MAGEPQSRLDQNRTGSQAGHAPAEKLSERLDRLEKEVSRLRADFALIAPEIQNKVDQKEDRRSLPELKIPFPGSEKGVAKGQLPEKTSPGKNDPIAGNSPGNRNYIGWAIGILGWLFAALAQSLKYILIPWVRNILLCILTFGILFSDWWVPMSSVWVFGPIWERLVLLVLAGIWWWLLALLFHQTLEKQDQPALPDTQKKSRMVEDSPSSGASLGKVSGVDKQTRPEGRLGSKAG